MLLTTSRKPSGKMISAMRDMLTVFPKATYYARGGYEIKEIIKYATKRGFTDLVVFHEDRKELNSLLVSHLPEGPTALYKITSYVPIKKIKGHGRATTHKPELVLNNFTTVRPRPPARAGARARGPGRCERGARRTGGACACVRR